MVLSIQLISIDLYTSVFTYFIYKHIHVYIYIEYVKYMYYTL